MKKKGCLCRLLPFLCYFCAASAHEELRLSTGRYLIDSYRSVDLASFDYIYTFAKSELSGRFIVLDEGSVWKVEPLGPEAISFYTQYRDPLEMGWVEEWVDLWQPGEKLIFHKISDRKLQGRDQFLLYNLDRHFLIDVSPFIPSPYANLLTISEIDQEEQLIFLSDGSAWHYDSWDKASQLWLPGEQIIVAKDTPWRSTHTHVLVNMSYNDKESSIGHIVRNRVSVTAAGLDRL